MSALTFQALRRLADGRFHSGEEVARELGRSRATLSEALKIAPELGIEIYSVRGKGYKLATPIEFIDVARVREAMGAQAARIALEVVDEIDSTSTRLMSRAMAGAASGTCLLAEWQSAGRGRRGRSWVASLGGSLTFSLLWRFERGAGHLGGLSLAVGVAVARALDACGVERIRVKWPNDVVCDFRKIAGILVETSGEMQGPSVAIIGAGINYRLGERVIDLIDQPVTDVAQCSAAVPSRSELLGRVLAQMCVALDAFDRHGFAALRDAWRERHAYHGKRVQVMAGREAPFEAEVVDVGADGVLVVRRDDGQLVSLASAEISLRPRDAPGTRQGRTRT